MSSFAAIVPLHGSSRDPSLVADLHAALRCSDWSSHSIWEGDGITLLRAAPSIGEKPAPLTASTAEWVVMFDGRLDSRKELLRELRSQGQEAQPTSQDSTLVAEAFAAWGERAPEHFIGEFSLVAWECRTRETIQVRDRSGVRPLFHARSRETLLISNDLSLLLAVGGLSAPLHAPAIADFLLFSGNQDLSRTSYRSIHRVPPAHWLRVNRAGDTQVHRYWALPQPETPRTISSKNAVEEFRVLFQEAVNDRVSGEQVAISLSGGLDSTSVAAAAVREHPQQIHSVTAGPARAAVDDEASYAREAARSLGIPWELAPSDDYSLFERWSDPHCRGLEPTDTPLRAAFVDLMHLLAAKGRLLLTGLAGDSVLYSSHQYFVRLLRSGRVLRALTEASSYAITRRRWPPLLFRSQALRALGLRSDQQAFPSWIREDFAREHDLRRRWAEFWSWREKSLHPWRPEAALFTQQAMWPNTFESYNSAWTGASLDLSVPFMDTRLVEFLFSLPPMPHFADKDLLRQAVKGWLPDRVRLRAKTPLVFDPVQQLLQNEPAERWQSRMALLDSYVEPRILQSAFERGSRTGLRSQQEIAARCLAEWLSFR